MANVMLKYLKFAQILNRGLSFSSVKYYPGLYLSRSYTNSKFGKSYATAAYKLALNEDSGMKNNDVRSSVHVYDIQTVDAALAKIDSLIKRNGRTQLKNIQKIFSSINSAEMTSSSHALYLIRSCKYCIDEPPEERTKMVNEIWNRYQELGIEFNVKHYNAMLDVHVKNNFNFNPVDILASMEDMKIEPNKDTYMLIMKKYCQDGNINGASEILEYMKEKQMAADEKVFNYLIEAHIINNDIAGAKEMVEVMRSSNLEPTADTHAIFACAYATRGDKENMMSHLKNCRSDDSVQNYLKVVEALASSGNDQYVDEVLSLIENKQWYQAEFMNAAVELTHKNCKEISYKLASMSCTPNYNEGINIFLKQLIKEKNEVSDILHYCERIRNEGLNPSIYVIAARASAEYGYFEPLVQVFRKMEELGYYIRPNSFWSLFLTIKEHKSPESCWSLLKSMCELGIPCDFRTYIDYVYPAVGDLKPREILAGIRQSGQATDIAADALFEYYCNNGELDYALELTEKYPISLSGRFDIENFLRLYREIDTESTHKYYKVLKHILMEDSEFPSKNDIRGKLLAELILFKKRLLENLLDKFQDLTFSEYTLYICEQELNARNVAKLPLLKKIKVLNAERESLSKLNQQENLSAADEDKYLSRLQAENLPCRTFLIKRILYHTKMKNVPRLQQLLLIFDELKLEYTPLMLCNLFGLWCTASDINKAKETLDKLKTTFPDFQIEIPKVLDYAALLLKYEKYDESYETLKEFLSKPEMYYNRDTLFRSVRRFNMVLSNTQNNEVVKKMQDLILPLSKPLGSKRSLLDPSVNMYLLRNDLKSALEEFRKIITAHHVPACLSQFLKKCINNNEKDILQQVIDLTIKYCGKSCALLELALAFIETYNLQNAVKVIENLGSETDPEGLNNLCSKLWQQNKINELENLIHITRSLDHVDRENLYSYLLKACDKKNDFQRALKLFEKMKEEGVEPLPETVKLLQDSLKKNNQPLPLSLISKSSSEISSLATEATKPFYEELKAGNSETALKELSSLKKGYIRTLTIETLTDLVDLCLQKNCTHELSLNVHAMSYIIEKAKDVLKPIMEKYSEAGDIEKFNLLMSFMPDFSLMSIGFNSYFCKAFIASGKYDTLLSHFEEHTTQKNKLFAVVAFEELLKMPEYEEKVFDIAVKYLDSNYSLPMTVIWAHYFSKGNYEKADDIYKKFSLNVDRVDNMILRSIKQNENVDLAKKYVDFIKSINIRSRTKERAYGAAVDILVFKGMYDEAAELVVDSERQDLQLHKYYLSTLVTLKSNLEKEKKPVPFKVPLDTTSGSDSDSDK